MTKENRSPIPYLYTEQERANAWNNPDVIVRIEEQRYPTQRALAKIISDVFRQHVPQGSKVFEVGAGSGYLKDLIPQEYHQSYISSDYNIGNLVAGQKRRELQIQQASASRLPLASNSIDCVVDMDAYDTLPNLQDAMNEAQRVLTPPNGTFIHFQVNLPSDDTVWVNYPDMIFFPQRSDAKKRRSSMVGIKREDLIRGVEHIKTPPFKRIVEDFLRNKVEAYVNIEASPNLEEMTDLIHELLDAMPVDKYYVPSLPDYFKSKLEKTATQARLEIVESQFRTTSLILQRSKSQMQHPKHNAFALENGSARFHTNPELKISGSSNVIEKATMLVFVAKKPQGR